MSFAPDLSSPAWVDPTERCPDCGHEMTRGADCCRDCEQQRIAFEEAQDDPREQVTGARVPRR